MADVGVEGITDVFILKLAQIAAELEDLSVSHWVLLGRKYVFKSIDKVEVVLRAET